MCVFCDIANGRAHGRLVYEDDEVVALHDTNPQAPTHVLVIPRKHVTSLSETSSGDTMLLGRLLEVLKQVAETLGVAAGYRVVINNGPSAGQSVMHLHLHLLAGRRMRWPPG